MPIYEYACNSCETKFEELIRSDEDARKLTCPKCGGRKVERRPSVFSAHAASQPTPLPRGGCGRCGDPQGPCGLG